MKKFLCLLCTLVLLASALASCNSKENKENTANDSIDPFELTSRLDAAYYLGMIVDDEEIKSYADEFEIRSKGIRYIVYAEPEEYYDERAGYFIFCQDTDVAMNLEEDLNDFLDGEDGEDFFTRGMVAREGVVVFFGCEDAWEDAQ